MSLLLGLLELSKKMLSRVYDYRFEFRLFTNFFVLFDQMSENGMVDGESLEFIELFDKFQAHGTPYTSVP